jgi:hypothetical protein
VARIADTFDHRTCIEAVFTGVNFYMKTGDYRPIPMRIRLLLADLTVERFYGQAVNHQSMTELCDRLSKAIRPWRVEMR